MKISKIPGLGRFGLFIDDLDLTNISDEEWHEVGKLHLSSLVTILRNVRVTKEDYGRLIPQWGDLRPSAYLSKKYHRRYGQGLQWVIEEAEKNNDLIDAEDRVRVKAAKQIAEITQNHVPLMKVAGGFTDDGLPKGLFATGDLEWHSNESGTLTFTPGVSLMGWEKMVGSSTGFLTTTDYYESLSESFRSELNDMIIVHRFTPGKINPGAPEEQDRLMNANMCPEDCDIPLVIKSPGGITGLHFSFNTVNQIKGATIKESEQLFDKIKQDLLTEKYVYDHWYQQDNDICLFDNTITQHRRLGYIDGRLAYRLPFDYTNLQDGAYNPYFQEPFRSRYIRQIHEIVRLLKIKNFKLPSRTVRSFLPL